MRAARIPPGVILDTSAVLTDSLLDRPEITPYPGFFRYVPHVGAAGPLDITAAEVERIIRRKKGFCLVQHVRLPPWNPAKHSGHDDGMAAASRALGVNYPLGGHIFCDLEGIEGTWPENACTAQYTNDWADAVVAAGFRAGCYVGYDVPLSPLELYLLHRMTSYWSDAGMRQVVTRGFAIKQQGQVRERGSIRIAGVPFDPNIVSLDRKGETPFWAIS